MGWRMDKKNVEKKDEGKGPRLFVGSWMVLLVGGQVRERFLAVVPWREFVKVK
jgi:hypothetical protein